MKNHLLKRIFCVLLAAALLVGYIPATQAASTLTWKESDTVVTPDLTDRLVESDTVQETYKSTDIVRVSIVLEKKPTVQAGFSTMDIARNDAAMAYSRRLEKEQATMAQTISTQVLNGQKLDVVWNLTLVGNIISANVPYGKIEAIRKVKGVKNVFVEMEFETCVVERESVAEPQMFSSLGMVGSALTWSGGYTGAGSRIAVIDTGTDTNHQSLDADAFLYALELNAQAAGMDYADYLNSLDLLDTAEINSVLKDLNAYERMSSLTASDLYLNEKLAFGFNYVDANLTIDHEGDDDYQGEHGSHVAGIATANRYIFQNGKYVDALETVMMAGVAPDAQLITMKVFGEESPYESDYMSAVEDAILLGCDSVNLSLGSTAAGFAFSDDYSQLLDYMTTTDTVVVASAGNSFAWPSASVFGYLYSDDVNMNTVGSPGSYPSFFSVASVENDGGIGPAFRVAGSHFFYAETLGFGNTALAGLDTSVASSGTEYDYVFIDGLGYTTDYAGMDLTGKIVFCSRGTLNYVVKANNALALGAEAVVIYNNVSGGAINMDLTGIEYTKPCVSISMESGDSIRALSTKQTTSGGLTYYTGKITIIGKYVGVQYGSDYYTMSNFSSWGVPGDLTLKPEITAPGGNIYSLYGENTATGGGWDQYETMSGTSMAAPAITGMVALMAQYIRENGLDDQAQISARHLAQSLLMSTAVPLYEEEADGNYYSLLKQGAGLARVDLASNADSYILVDGQADGKVKAELGDDPDRTGVYNFSFSINNLSGEAESYVLSADVFCQDVFEYQEDSDVFLMDTWTTDLPAVATFSVNGKEVTAGTDLSDYDLNGDGSTNTYDADYLLEYLLGNETKIYGTTDVNGDGSTNTYDAHILLALLAGGEGFVRVPANGSVTVDVKLTLTAEGKAMLNENYANGTYVEAFVYAEAVSDEEGTAGTVHSIPVLAFYGNWSDATMFDRGTTVELHYLATNEAPYLYQVMGIYGNNLSIDYGDGNEYYFGGNPYVDDRDYLPERNAFNSEDSSKLAYQNFTLIRNASDMQIRVSNADTGEIYLQRGLGMANAAYYIPANGTWANTQQRAKLNWTGTDASGNPLPEGTNVEVSLIAVPEYYRNDNGTHNYNALGDGAYMTTRFTIDNTAPTIKNAVQNDSTLTVTVQDNEYVAAVVLMNAAGTSVLAPETPNQTVKNALVSIDLDLTGLYGENFLVAVFDYAGNVSTYDITLELPELEREYFTAIDTNSMDYVGMNMAGQVTHLVSTGLPLKARAAEYVGGYVFIITEDNSLCVANDEDLGTTQRICQLDPTGSLLITGFNDMAYNHADGKLYGQFYSNYNDEILPYLCTIDMSDGSLEVICELPVDVNTMAIDTQGNFYSATFGNTSLYTYTLADVTAESPFMSYVGEMGYYWTTAVSSMAWDHNTGKLYWAYPDALLEINPETAEPTLLGYHTESLVGLYTRPEEDEGMFDPTNNVDRVELNHTNTRAIIGSALPLEASVWPWNVSDRTVTWTSSNTAVATVDANGVVNGVSAGTVTITATSNLDPTKKATCTVTVEAMPEKVLNALVWDEEGEIWMSEFDVTDLLNYTKLSSADLGENLASATVGQDGVIYAASLDYSTMKSSLYTLDPETFEPTLIGPSTDGYMDLAPAPSMPGNSLAAAYGGNVLLVDTVSGDYYAWYNMFSYNLVGIAYIGSQEYTDWGYNTAVDWYFIIDRVGYVYLLGFLEQDGSYYYLEHDLLAPGGIYTKLDFEMDTPYFGSAYFDGEFLYFSAYKEAWNNVTLMAIDVASDSRVCYTLGTFADGVWPVGGLMELDLTTLPDYMKAEKTSQPKAMEKAEKLEAPAVSDVQTKAAGTVHSFSGSTIAPKSSGELADKNKQVVVTLTTGSGISMIASGRMDVEYDPTQLKLVSVNGTTEAFAYADNNGIIDVAYASAAALAPDATVATLVFEVIEPAEYNFTITYQEADNEPFGKQEFVTVDNRVIWCKANASLGGDISLHFYVRLADSIVNDPDAYMYFSYGNRVFEIPVSEGTPSTYQGKPCYQFTCKVVSKSMADLVTARVMSEGEQAGPSCTNSIQNYAEFLLTYYPEGKLANLVKAMLNYGAAAQIHFNYNTDNLANVSLSEEDKFLPDVDASAYANVLSGQADGISVQSATLLLDAETIVRVYYTLTGSKTIDEYTFTVNGKEVTPIQTGNRYYVEVRGISAHRLDEVQTFTADDLKLEYSALSYVEVVIRNSETNSEALIELCKALYAYSMAAEAYLSK